MYRIKDNGDKAAVMFMSRSLWGSELNYFTTEKELLVIVYCLQKARPLILGAKLIIQTNHQGLDFLKRCRLLNSRLSRWILAIQEYNFEIEQCKGSENIVADTLSRTNSDNNNPVGPDLVIGDIRRVYKESLKEDLGKIARLQRQQENINNIIQNLNEQNTEYKLKNNVLFKNHNNQSTIENHLT